LNKKDLNINTTSNHSLLLLEHHYSSCQIYLAFDTSHGGDFCVSCAKC